MDSTELSRHNSLPGLLNKTLQGSEKLYSQPLRILSQRSSPRDEILSPLKKSSSQRASPSLERKRDKKVKILRRPDGELLLTNYSLSNSRAKVDSANLDVFRTTSSKINQQRVESRALRTRQQSREYSSQILEATINLKGMFNKYENSNKKSDIPSRMHLTKVFECLELLNDEESESHSLMTSILKVIKSALYISPKMAANLESKYKIFQDEEELNIILKNTLVENIPYSSLSVALIQTIDKQETKAYNLKQSHRAEIQDLNLFIEEKNRKIEELTTQLSECVTREIYENLVEEKNDVIKMYENVCKENKSAQDQINELKQGLLNVMKQREKDAEESKGYLDRIAEVEEISEEALRDTSKYKQLIINAQKRIQMYKSVMDAALLKFSNIKAQITSLMRINEELECENYKLGIRAGTGFQNLTPRPNYKQLMKEKGIELDIYNANGVTQKATTNKIVDELLNKLLDAHSNRGSGLHDILTIDDSDTKKEPHSASEHKNPSCNDEVVDKNEQVAPLKIKEQNMIPSPALSAKVVKSRRASSVDPRAKSSVPANLPIPQQSSKMQSGAGSRNTSKRSSIIKEASELQVVAQPKEESSSINDSWDSFNELNIPTRLQPNMNIGKAEVVLKIDTFRENIPRSSIGKEVLVEVDEGLKLIVRAKNTE